MDFPKIHESEYRFCLIMWEHEPVTAVELVKLCQNQLGWKRTTTYTVIKRLGDRGVLKNDNGTITSLVSKDEAQACEIDELVEKKFEGSLPAFIAAFTKHQAMSEDELDEMQRSGRIIRQGNRNKEVHIYRYVTESTFDAYLWQTVENKQKFISQIMTSKSPVRSCEDIDEAALSYAEIKALCAGDERIREKMDLDVDVARLRLMKANHQSQQYRLEDNILRHFPAQIEENKGFLSGFEADMKTLEQHPHPKDGFAGMEVKGDLLTDKDNAGAAILEAFKDAKGLESVPIGTYRGFSMSLTVENFGKDFILTLKGRMSHRVELGKDARGNLVRIDNALAQMPERYKTVQGRLENVQAQLATAKAELGKPFPQETELKEKSARLAELNAELNIDDRTPLEQAAENVVAKRPSVLGKLKAPCAHGAGEKKKSHEQEAR